MCGIAGVWARELGHGIWDVAGRLGPALRHRGPDEEGWLAGWVRSGRATAVRHLSAARGDDVVPPDIILAHRRLSIVDLTTGWQPIGNESGDIWIVYNGEIYNHLALREELESLGHRFGSHSDTEMVVHAYEAWGSDGFARFNGIFAFGLWDGRRRRLLLARDPLGVKPLYFGAGRRGAWFSSEVKAAIEAGLCEPALNRAALDLYLTYRFVPSPDTLFRGVGRVPPGHWVAARDDERGWTEPARFAPLPAGEDHAVRQGEWIERLSTATREAVTAQLMADVPVGALLSGGLDSSILVSVMSRQREAPVATYAIGFGDGERESELDVARRSAAALGTAHHEVVADAANLFDDWVTSICQIDEPVVTPSHAPLGALCRRVRQDLKVVLTGQGADEPLGGYLRHSVERWVHLLGLPPVAAALRLGAAWRPRSELAQRLAAVVTERDLALRIVAAFTVFGAARRRALLKPESGSEHPDDAVLAPVRLWLEGSEGLDTLNRLLYVDARLSLADDLLLGTDKVSMASSVEARVPYLDLHYLSLAERIPGRLKISLARGRKRLQHLVGRRLLPPSLARELTGVGSGWRKKRGFDVPVGRWFGGSQLPRLTRLLTGPEATLPEYLDRGAILALLHEHSARRADHGRRLVALVTLEAWHRAFIGGDLASLRTALASSPRQ